MSISGLFMKALVAALLLGSGVSVHAQLLCGSPSCSVSTGGMAFGSGYDPFDVLSHDSAAATITVECSATSLLLLCQVPYEVSMNTGSAGSYDPREMQLNSSRLEYNIYTDPTRLLIWGDGISSETVTVIGALIFPILFGGTVSADHQAYGRIFAGQVVETGSYSDSVLVTVEF